MKISIIVPVYKAENYLNRCIDSILAQTFTDWELLLIDDGSPDRSGEICDEYAAKDSRIRVFHKENGGVSSARNLGLEKTGGDYVWFVDSDDWIENWSIEQLMTYMMTYGLDICFFCLNAISKCSVQLFSYEKFLNNDVFRIYTGYKECAESITSLEMCGGLGWTCNKIFKRSIIAAHNIKFDTRFSIQEDHLFTLSYLLYVKRILVTKLTPYNYEIKTDGLFKMSYPFYVNQMRMEAMLKARLNICKVFPVNKIYTDWFTTDYISRKVRNLRNIKNSNMTVNESLREIKQCNRLVKRYKVNSKQLYKYKLICWLPNRIILLFCHCSINVR